LLGDSYQTTAIEHAIPTSGVDPCREIATRDYRIPEALKGELQGITDQLLRDKIIKHSNSPWNFGEKGRRCIQERKTTVSS
jgi:hypothetical protein